MADRGALTSPGSSDTAMEGHSRPAKMAALNFGQAQAQAQAQDLALEHMGLNLSLSGNRYQNESYKLDDRMALWYRRNDGPWEPPGLISSQGDIRSPSILGAFRAGQPLFPNSHYRESIVPSECDTVPPGVIPSDSGYGGSYRAKHSVTNGSVCDESLDRNPETQSLAGHMNDLNFRSYNPDMITKGVAGSTAPWNPSQPQSSSSIANRQVNYEGSQFCEVCNKLLKTKSEFKKHKQRHDKPFKCDVPNCPRTEGFSTPNDLDRHKRSVHPDEKAAGNRFRCPIGACRNRDKIWPRADNFRAHMKRVHQKASLSDDELDRYKLRPSSQEDPDLLHGSTAPHFDQFNGYVIGNTNTGPSGWEPHRNPVIDISAAPSPPEVTRQIQVEETSLVNKTSREDRFHMLSNIATHRMEPERSSELFNSQMGVSRAVSPRPNPTLYSSRFSQPEQLENNTNLHPESPDTKLDSGISSLDYDEINKLDQSQESPDDSSFESAEPARQSEELEHIDEKIHAPSEPKDPKPVDDNMDFTDHNMVLKIIEKLDSSGVLKQYGWKKEDPPRPRSEDAQEEPANPTTGEMRHACPNCPKRFARRCELKKHEKRHEKPYGCTFPGCTRHFGSKNDWKRHENSQHFMLEHWRCDEKPTDNLSQSCGKIVHRRELFKQHLESCHQIKDQMTIDRKLGTCRVGRNCDTRFWCGFCQKTIEITKQCDNPWTERFNHIDDHYQGRNTEKKVIGDWKGEDLLRSRDESAADDSEDTSGSSSPGVLHAPGLEKQRPRSASSKRKRDDTSDSHVSKRPNIGSYHCCQCQEAMPAISGQCNFPCEHRLCGNCHLSQ